MIFKPLVAGVVNMAKQHLRTIYQEDGCLLGVSDGKCYLVLGDITFRLDSNIYEPCLYIKGSDGTMVTLHHAFTVDTLCHAAETNGKIMMVTGNEYDIRGIITLIRKAIDLSKDSVDIGYVEGHCFMDYMVKHGALSPETAVDLADAGMKNSSLYAFIHSKKIGQTSDGLFYLIRPKKEST